LPRCGIAILKLASALQDSDVNAFVDTWKFVKSVRGKKGPKTLSQFIVDRGGVYDGTGDVMQLLGEYTAAPWADQQGLVEDLDDIGDGCLGSGLCEPPGPRHDQTICLDALAG
jgi:hypothetical protein